MPFLIIKLLYSIEGIGAVCGVTVVLIFGLTILGLSCGIQVGHHFFQMRGLGCLGYEIMKHIHRSNDRPVCNLWSAHYSDNMRFRFWSDAWSNFYSFSWGRFGYTCNNAWTRSHFRAWF